MAIHSSILARKIPLAEEPGGPQSYEVAKSDTAEVTEDAQLCPINILSPLPWGRQI